MRLRPSGMVAISVLLTLLLRTVYFLEVRDNPYFETPVMDEAYHDAWAKEIAAGNWRANLPFFRAPLYPVLLGVLYSAFGPDYALIRGLQLLLGAVSPLLAFLLGRRILPGNDRLPALAALAVAADGILIYYEGDLLLEAVLAPLSLLFLLLVLRAGSSGRPRDWLFAGLALGTFAITRPNVLLFAPAAFGLALGWRGTTWRLRPLLRANAAAVTLGTCVVVLPVTAANWTIGGDRVLIAWQGGLNFFLGNNEEANGWSATAPLLMRTDWWGGYEDAITIAEREEGRELKSSEISRYWTRRALKWWSENPVDGLVMTVRKCVYFLSGEEFSNNRNIDLFIRDYAPSIFPARYLLVVVTPLACVGAISLWRGRKLPGRVVVLYAAVYAATIVLFFVTARYRVPLRPILVLLAIEGGRALFALARRSPGRGAAAIGATAAFGAAVNSNPWVVEYEVPPAQFYQSIANIYHGRGDLEREQSFQLRVLEEDPAYPDGNLNLGTMYMSRGDIARAIAAFERERSLDPTDARNLASLGQAYAKAERFLESDAAYSAAERFGHTDAAALYYHGVLLERLERTGDAEALYRRAIESDSTFVDAWNNLGVLQARAGRLSEAAAIWERALTIRPGDEKISENLDRARGRLTGAASPHQEGG